MRWAVEVESGPILPVDKLLSAYDASAHVIDDLTIVFNTAMHHIFLGMNPLYIGRSPFIPAVQNSLDIKARDLGIRIAPGAYVHVLPIEAGFVGAGDTLSAAIAALLASGEELHMATSEAQIGRAHV